MSLQLIVYPQFFDGANPLSSTATELVVDGINFTTVNTSSNTTSFSGTLPQAFIDATSFSVNTWYRFSNTTVSTI